MDLITRLLVAIDAAASFISKKNKRYADDYYEVVSVVNDFTFKMVDGTFVSFLNCNGLTATLNEIEKKGKASLISDDLSSFFSEDSKGFLLQTVQVRDKEVTRTRLTKSMQPSIDELKNMGLDAHIFTDGYKEFLLENGVWSERYIAVRTSPDASYDKPSEMEIERSNKDIIDATSLVHDELEKRVSDVSFVLSAHERSRLETHKKFTRAVLFAMNSNQVEVRPIDAKNALKRQHEYLYSKGAVKTFDPTLGYLQVKKNNSGNHKDLKTEILPLSSQVLTSGFDESIGGLSVVQIGNRLATTLYMTSSQLFEEKLKPFNSIIAKLPLNIDYMASQMLESNPFGSSKAKLNQFYATLNSLMGVGSSLRIRSAVRELGKRQESHEPFCAMQYSITIFADNEEELIKHVGQVENALGSWNKAKFRKVEMDTTQGVFDTLFGATSDANFVQTFESLSTALYMSPLFGRARMYDNAYIHFLGENNELLPHAENHARSINFNTKVTGESGTGKSTLLFVLNMALLAVPKTESSLKGELPLIMNMDFGKTTFSSTSIMKLMCTNGRPEQFMAIELSNSPDKAINIHDLPLGLFMPTENHLNLIVRFMTILYSGVEEVPHPDGNKFKMLTSGIESFVREIVGTAYSYFSETISQKKMNFSEFEHVRTLKLIEKAGVAKEDIQNYSYYELADLLFEKYSERALDHIYLLRRYAVPNLSDYATVVSNSDVLRTKYDGVKVQSSGADAGEIIDYFNRRTSELLKEYPCFGVPTAMSFEQGRVISLELKAVSNAGATSKAAFIILCFTLYMLKKVNIENFPDLYSKASQEYIPLLTKQSEINRILPSALNVEEAHILLSLCDVMMCEFQRENRKANWGLRTFTQRLTDSSDDFFGLCANVFSTSIQNFHTAPFMKRLKEMDLSIAEENIVRKGLTDISSTFMFSKTKKVKLSGGGFDAAMGAVRGTQGDNSRYKLGAGCVIPPSFLWMTVSDQFDHRMIERAVQQLPPKEAFMRLLNYFPTAASKQYKDNGDLISLAKENGFDGVFDYLIDEMMKNATPSIELQKYL
jgi:hypothetical protein